LNYEILKTVSQISTYIGLSASSLLTWINLHFKTALEPESGHRKVLTSAGRASRAFLVISFVLTIASAIVQNYADSKLRAAAAKRGTEAIQQALEAQHNKYVNDLRQQFEGTNGVLPKIGEQTRELGVAESRIIGLSRETINQLTGFHSYAYLGYVPGQGFLAFVHRGRHPLYGVSARIIDLQQMKETNNLEGFTVSVGDMIRGHANIQPLPSSFGTSDRLDANIFFTARNGDWTQLLRERRVSDHKWVRATRVVGRFTSLAKEKIMCETIDRDFPRDSKGAIDKDFPAYAGRTKLPLCQ
jgi:hypothetical protein